MHWIGVDWQQARQSCNTDFPILQIADLQFTHTRKHGSISVSVLLCEGDTVPRHFNKPCKNSTRRQGSWQPLTYQSKDGIVNGNYQRLSSPLKGDSAQIPGKVPSEAWSGSLMPCSSPVQQLIVRKQHTLCGKRSPRWHRQRAFFLQAP